ncbi:MAG: hypothetical protein HKP24_12965 [Croceitalea sp.]|nr:hypothetical protein [Croceitalea sp.]NNM19468.1 hypothetical protein [Croceitalea sp.]
MKKILFITLVVCAMFTTRAQEDYSDMVKVGDELMISNPSGSDYQYIDVPRKNFIIKRGGIANMATLKNAKVTVTKITFKDSKPIIRFKKSDGRKFFNAFRTLTADLNNAIAQSELNFIDKSKKDTTAR